MEQKPKTKLADLIRPLIHQVNEMGFKKVEPKWAEAIDVTMLYLDKKADLKQLRLAASQFVDMKNKSILDKRPRDAMLYDVMAYIGSCLESSAAGEKEECLQYLAAARRLLKEAQAES